MRRILSAVIGGFATTLLCGCPASYARVLQPGEYEKAQGREIVFTEIPADLKDYDRSSRCSYSDWHLEPDTLSERIGAETSGKRAKLGPIQQGSSYSDQFQTALVEDGRTVFYPVIGSVTRYNLTYFADELPQVQKRVGSHLWYNSNAAFFVSREMNVAGAHLKNLDDLELVAVRPRTHESKDYCAPFEICVKTTSGTSGYVPYEPEFFYDKDPGAGWTAEMRAKVAANKLTQGMTADQLTASWGKPDKVNRTVLPGAVEEQWIYKHEDTYVYLRGDVVYSWQSSR